MKEEEVRNIIADHPAGRVKEIDDADYTIGDQDDYDLFIFSGLSVDRTLTFPALSSHFGKKFKVINADGSYGVDCTPAGTDKINSYAAVVEITEKWGWWEFRGATSQWVGSTDGHSTLYSTEFESSYAKSSATTTTYYDTGVEVTLPTAGVIELLIQETFTQ